MTLKCRVIPGIILPLHKANNSCLHERMSHCSSSLEGSSVRLGWHHSFPRRATSHEIHSPPLIWSFLKMGLLSRTLFLDRKGVSQHLKAALPPAPSLCPGSDHCLSFYFPEPPPTVNHQREASPVNAVMPGTTLKHFTLTPALLTPSTQPGQEEKMEVGFSTKTLDHRGWRRERPNAFCFSQVRGSVHTLGAQ